MTVDESEKILADVKNSLKSITIDENAENIVTYDDSVIHLEDTAKVSDYNGMVIISGTKKSISAGDVFVANVNEFAHLYKAVKVTKGQNNNLIVTTAEADIDSALKKVDIQGVGTVDYDNIKYYNTAPSAAANSGKTSYMSSTKYLASKDIVPVNIDTDIGSAKVTITGSIDNIEPKFRVTKDENGGLDGFYLEASADANLKAVISEKINKEIKIADVPVVSYLNSGGVMKATLSISAIVSISGNITLSYSWGVNGGISYQKGSGWRLTKDFKKKAFTLDVKVDQSLAVKANLSAEILFGAAKGNIYLMGGEKGSAYGTERENDVSCTTLKAYLFAEVGASFKVIGLNEFSKTYPFITEANSPMKIYKHWENDKLVPKCTYGDDGAGSTSSSKSSSPVKYSEYGTYFDGLISDNNSSDTNSDGSTTKWIEKINLKGDTVIYGDLDLSYKDVLEKDTYGNYKTVRKYFESLNLNGFTLTVKGDIHHSRGLISINNGTLNVEGSYIMENTASIAGEIEYSGCSAQLDMCYDFDTVNIKGDFITHNLSGSTSFGGGTIAIGGDIWSDGGISAFSKHITVLSGDGDQNVYFENSLGRLKVLNPDKRNITWKNYMSVNLISDINIIPDNIVFGEVYLNKNNMVINGDIVQNGTIYFDGGMLTVNGNFKETSSIALGGGTLNVNGDYTHVSGSLNINKGKLNIDGNYYAQNAKTLVTGETEYSNCSASFGMNDDFDTVNITGDFITHNLSGYISFLEGTIAIGGNIWSDGGISTSSSNGHIIILNGDKPQKVTLSSSNQFNILKLTQPKSNYTFSPNPCWNTLIEAAPVVTTTVTTTTSVTTTSTTTTTVKTTTTIDKATTSTSKSTTTKSVTTAKTTTTTNSATTTKPVTTTTKASTTTIPVTTTTPIEVSGDLNGDNSINAADIVELQKYLTKISKTISVSADLNGDGKVNVFDMIILRRLVLKK